MSADHYIRAAESLIVFVDEEVRPPLSGERSLNWVQLAVITYFYRSSDTYEGVLFLCREGLGVQAAMLDRSLIEDVIDAHWVTVEGDLAMERMREYARWHAHDRIRASGRHPTYFDEKPKTTWDPMSDEETRDYVKVLRGGGGSWTGVKTGKRIETIEDLWRSDTSRAELRFFADWVQGQNTGFLHSGPLGLAAITERHGDGWRMRPRESGFFVRQAIHAAIWAYSQIITLLLDELGLPGKERFESEVFLASQEAFSQGESDGG